MGERRAGLDVAGGQLARGERQEGRCRPVGDGDLLYCCERDSCASGGARGACELALRGHRSMLGSLELGARE
jgi:hypothetical protein